MASLVRVDVYVRVDRVAIIACLCAMYCVLVHVDDALWFGLMWSWDRSLVLSQVWCCEGMFARPCQLAVGITPQTHPVLGLIIRKTFRKKPSWVKSQVWFIACCLLRTGQSDCFFPVVIVHIWGYVDVV